MIPFENAAFRSELRRAIPASFAELQRQRANERIYGYSLCLDALGSFVGAYGQTEEGLGRIVETYQLENRYRARKGDLTAHLRAMLRWNCEDGWLFLADPYFEEANRLLREPHHGDADAFYDRGATRLVYLECLAALAECDASGLFGRGQDREAVTLNLYLGDQSHEMLLRWADQIDPHPVCERLRDELVAEIAAGDQLEYVGRGS